MIFLKLTFSTYPIEKDRNSDPWRYQRKDTTNSYRLRSILQKHAANIDRLIQKAKKDRGLSRGGTRLAHIVRNESNLRRPCRN